MIPITSSTPILIAIKPVDFRCQIDGLAAHCRRTLSNDPMSGTFFIFINRAKTMIRVLVYDDNGFWLMTKRLSKGRFSGWPKSSETLTPLTAKLLMKILKAPSVKYKKNSLV